MSAAEREAALTVARDMLARYRGPCSKGAQRLAVGPDVVPTVRSIVGAALHAAPQPVTRPWVSYSLAVIGGLVAAVDARAGSLDPASLLSERSLARHVHDDRRDLSTHSRASYRVRLEIIADGYFRPPSGRTLTRPPLSDFGDVVAYRRHQEDDLVAWAAGLKTPLQRPACALSSPSGWAEECDAATCSASSAPPRSARAWSTTR